jgi:hypothetical protein
VEEVIEWLRFVGLLNAALWLGSCMYHVFGAAPAVSSKAVEQLLGPVNTPFFATAIQLVLDERFLTFQLVFALIACTHVLTMWLYLGQTPRRLWLGLLGGLLFLVLMQSLWLQPLIKARHATRHSIRATPQMRVAADRSFRAWHGFSNVCNLLQVIGVAVYFWRVVNPSEATRFVSAVKFRS